METAGGTVTVKDFKYTDNMRYTALYLLFAYFWTSEFIVAMGQVLIITRMIFVIGRRIKWSILLESPNGKSSKAYSMFLFRPDGRIRGLRRHLRGGMRKSAMRTMRASRL